MSFRAFALILILPLVARADDKKIDFSDYDKPLFVQIVDHAKARISHRIGEGVNAKDRFFILPFAYENEGNDPAYSHSFISVVRVFADDKQPKTTPGLQTQKYKNREFEAFTISWLPADFTPDSHLCVFDGFASRLIAHNNKCPISPGRNFGLEETLKLAIHAKNAVAMWGPYEISKPGFDLGIKRKELLDSGKIKYRADDRMYRKSQKAINCFHAMASLETLYPSGGFLNTGLKMWGFNGTARVLVEYNDRGREQGLLLEPANAKKDRVVFVYAAKKNGVAFYNPADFAFAYAN